MKKAKYKEALRTVIRRNKYGLKHPLSPSRETYEEAVRLVGVQLSGGKITRGRRTVNRFDPLFGRLKDYEFQSGKPFVTLAQHDRECRAELNLRRARNAG